MIKKVNDRIKTLSDKKPVILGILNEVYDNIKDVKNLINSKITKIKEVDILIYNMKNDLKMLEKENEKHINLKNKYKILFEEVASQIKTNEFFLSQKNLEKEKKKLSYMKKKIKEKKDLILEMDIKILNLSDNLREEESKLQILKKEKNVLEEEYDKVNKIAINDNIFCFNNFYSSLIYFPYFKNIAFISNNNEETEKNGDFYDENKIIIEKEMNDYIENEKIKNIKYLIKQKENGDKNFNFKILEDRRTLQINKKEKYKFNKIFSIINNNYIAEPWTEIKYNSFKLSTINTYLNEFNMTNIFNNYFIIYLLQNLDKNLKNNDLYKLFQQMKNNEYINKNIIIKISVITEFNYINLININQQSEIDKQLLSIKNEGHSIFGFLYEFIKTNRLNKKNVFRIYNFDYSYPYIVEMLNSISRYYAKIKRKKAGIYKKVMKYEGKGESKKKKSNNNTSENKSLNKGKEKSKILNKKSNNINKINYKGINNSGNLKNNNSFVTTNVKKKESSENKNIKKNCKSNISEENKIINKNLKEAGVQKQIKEEEKNSNNNLNERNNIKVVKFESAEGNNNSANKITKKYNEDNLVFNDLTLIRPEHTLVIHDINSKFIDLEVFKNVAKACRLLMK